MIPALWAFLQAYLGVPDTGDTPGNKGQCVGLIECWADVNHKPHIAGNAVDLLGNADPNHYSYIKNGPLNAPPAGAIVCWDGSWGGGYGHTAIVLVATSMVVVVFEQNDPDGASPTVATHSYAGVAGWLVMK